MVQETSAQAYREIKPQLSSRQDRILRALRNTDPNQIDFTNTELAVQLNWPINTVTPRVFELREYGLVELSRKRICKITGKRAMAWHVRNLGKPRRYYVLLTRCGRCAKLRPLRVNTIRVDERFDYVLGVSEKDVIHPVTKEVTLRAGEPYLFDGRDPVAIYTCPRGLALHFEDHTCGQGCIMFEGVKKWEALQH